MIIPMICDLHIAEFWIKDFLKEFSTIVALFIFYIVYLVVILFTVERTYKEVGIVNY